MKIKNFFHWILFLILVYSFDNSLTGGRMFRKALAWVVIIGLLIVVVRLVSAQATEDGHCVPAVVYWKFTNGVDTMKVESYTCVDFRGDSVVLIPHIAGGIARDMMLVHKKQVTKIILLQPVQTADLKPRA